MEIWQLAREISKEVFHLYQNSLLKKDWALWHQMNKSSGSVMDNIAEGFERNGNKEFIQYLYHAKGSCGEVRTQICLARDLDYLTEDTFDRLYELVKRTGQILSGLIRYLAQSEMKGNKFK